MSVSTIQTYYHLVEATPLSKFEEAAYHNERNMWVGGMSLDCWYKIFSKFAFLPRELASCRLTCKSFNEIILSPPMGQTLKPFIKFTSNEDGSWFEHYAALLNRNHIIAVDVSQSMEPGVVPGGRLFRALSKVRVIAEGIFDISNRGIRMIIFTNEKRSTDVHSMEELENAIAVRGIGNGSTDLDLVIEEVFQFHRNSGICRLGGENQPARRKLCPTHVHLLSDFEVHINDRLQQEFTKLASAKDLPSLTFYCYNYSNTALSTTFLNSLFEHGGEDSNIQVNRIDDVVAINDNQEDNYISDDEEEDTDSEDINLNEIF